MKKVILDGKYELGGGAGSWAKSRETKTVTQGDTRVIGGILMYAYSIYPAPWYSFKKTKVNWTPVDPDIAHDFQKLQKWMANVS
jgi:hypothetical protein